MPSADQRQSAVVRKLDQDKYLREMRKRIRKAYTERGRRRPNQISPGEELRIIVERHRNTRKVIPWDIQLWLTLLDEAVSFWFAVWAIYKDEIKGPSDKRLICLMALSGRVLQDLFCVRELIVGGFFVQSNVVARSLIEAIDVMHLLNSRPELATEFRQIEENSGSSRFWHTHCSNQKIDKIIKERWRWFFSGDEEVASAFHLIRENYKDLVGMSAHPSFAACFVTFMDGPDEDSNIAKNAMGSISQMSKFTIHLILIRMFEYGLLWSGPEIGLYKEGVNSKLKQTLHDNISKGLSVLLSMVKMLGEQVKGDPFFPDFKTYWPRSNFD